MNSMLRAFAYLGGSIGSPLFFREEEEEEEEVETTVK